ncbi:MAG: DNA-processing protein DprA [Rhodothermales bacterium]|nr:DNA-processing protein DprA [Rhodothermales bacterium]
MPVSPRSLLAHALERLDGVGRISAGRLLRYFESYEALTSFPREQVLTRLKSAPNGGRLVDRLFDRAEMEPILANSAAELGALTATGITPLAAGDPGWPAGIALLPAAEQPNLLYVYGATGVLRRPLVAFFGKATLRTEAFEYAQGLAVFLASRGIHPVIGAAHGFDVVLAKLSASPESPAAALMTCACGLAQIAPPVRPTVSATVRAGGALMSSFALHHPHYPHQDDDQALLMAATASAGVFLDPAPGEPAWKALEWMLATHQPVFATTDGNHALPKAVHLLASDMDQEWVAASLTLT